MRIEDLIQGIGTKLVDIAPVVTALNCGHITIRIDANDGKVQKLSVIDMKLISK